MEPLWSRLRDAFFPKVANEAVDLTGLSPSDFAALLQLPTYAGVTVTPESAMKAIPVQACCALIAGGIMSMPLSVLRRKLENGTFIREPADDHPYWWLFNESPNDDMTAAEFWQKIVIRLLLYGQSFARIVRAVGGRSNDVVELVPHDNRAVTVVREYDSARRRYRISHYVVMEEGKAFSVAPEDMLHFPGKIALGAPARSAILESAREAIGIVLAIEQYCGRIFTNGGTPRVALEYPAGVKITDEQKGQIREAWLKWMGGGENSHLPFVVGAGGKINKISWTADEQQMLDARKFQVIDIARAFGAPPFMIGETEKTSAWGSGIEQMGQGFIRYTLSPHATPIEQEITRKLFMTSRHYVDFDEESLARGDMKSLGAWFRQAIGGSQGPGFLTPNEVRRRLNQPPAEGGDKLYDPGDKLDANAQPTDDGETDPTAPDGEQGQAA